MNWSHFSPRRRRMYLTALSISGDADRLSATDPTLVAVSSSSSSLMTEARTLVGAFGSSFFLSVGLRLFASLLGQSLDICPCFLQLKHRPSLESFSRSSLESLLVVFRASTSMASGSFLPLTGFGSKFFIRLRLVLTLPFPPAGPREVLTKADHCISSRHPLIQSSRVRGSMGRLSTARCSQTGSPCLNRFRVPWVFLSQWAPAHSSSKVVM
jgi:hypothetical protein